MHEAGPEAENRFERWNSEMTRKRGMENHPTEHSSVDHHYRLHPLNDSELNSVDAASKERMNQLTQMAAGVLASKMQVIR